MAFRRRSFRRPMGRRRRFSGTRKSVEPQRWETAQFNIVNTVASESTPVVTFNELMKVDEHFGDEATFPGQVMANMIRYVEVGGVVFDFQVAPLTNAAADVVNYCQMHISLVTSPISSGGVPNAWNPFATQPPVATVFNADSTDLEMPTRIHWRKYWLAPDGDLNFLVFPSQANMSVVTHGTHSLRLRRRIDDHQGLYFVVATSGSAVAATVYTYAIHGTLYYRVRF